jgi:glycerophosphoryl diester phosphodiesterase
MDWLLSTPIAHRGLHDAGRGVPENSLAAFEAARDAGLPIELDVRLLRDGAVAVFHDDNLMRLTGTDSPVAREDSRSITGHRLVGTGQSIPLLAQALDAVNGKVPLLIELKNSGPPGKLELAVLSDLEAYRGLYAVQSFNPFSMEWFKRRAPHVARGHLAGATPTVVLEGTPETQLQPLELIEKSAPAFVGFNVHLLPFEPVTALRRGGMPILGWTVRSDADRRRALEHCDNYIFEGIDPFSPNDET